MTIRMLGRSEFCKLTGLEVEQLNALRRRDQVPLVPNLDLPEEVANERGYAPFGAFALIIANELSERYGMSRDRSAEIASYSLRVHARWKQVAETSAQVAAGDEPTTDILFAAIDWPVAKPKKRGWVPKMAIGTLKEIGAAFPNASTIIAVSATRCAALLRQRAVRAGIDIEKFWEV